MKLAVLMTFFRKVDDRFQIDSYQNARSVYLFLTDVGHILLRLVDRFRLKMFVAQLQNDPVHLHLGCGEQRKPNCINIDWRKTIATDFVQDITALPLPEASVDSIESYHVIEHLGKNDAERMLANWYRTLKPNGKVVIECPNFDETVKEYLAGNQERIYNVYGYRRFPGDAHQFGYNFERLRQALAAAGFSNIVNTEPQDYHIMEEPCLRVEAKK